MQRPCQRAQISCHHPVLPILFITVPATKLCRFFRQQAPCAQSYPKPTSSSHPASLLLAITAMRVQESHCCCSFAEGTSGDDIIMNTGSEVGALLVDGLGDGVAVACPSQDLSFLRNMSFGVLQGSRMRNTKTGAPRHGRLYIVARCCWKRSGGGGGGGEGGSGDLR